VTEHRGQDSACHHEARRCCHVDVGPPSEGGGAPLSASTMRAISGPIASIPRNGSFAPVATRSMTPVKSPPARRSMRTTKLRRLVSAGRSPPSEAGCSAMAGPLTGGLVNPAGRTWSAAHPRPPVVPLARRTWRDIRSGVRFRQPASSPRGPSYPGHHDGAVSASMKRS